MDLYQIQYFSEEDIWVTSHCLPYHWDGIEWNQYHLENMGMDTTCVGSAIWGTSSSIMYFVGLNGSIVHYDGSEFTKMESGTDLDLTDIWGIDENNIWVSGIVDAEYSSIILKKDGFGWNKIYEDLETSGLWLQSIYTDNTDILYLASGYRSIYNFNTHEITYNSEDPSEMASRKVRGNSKNDLFYVGYLGEVSHYNGITWHNYPELEGNLNRLNSLDVKENIIVGVGYIYHPTDSQGFIVIGKRF